MRLHDANTTLKQPATDPLMSPTPHLVVSQYPSPKHSEVSEQSTILISLDNSGQVAEVPLPPMVGVWDSHCSIRGWDRSPWIAYEHNYILVERGDIFGALLAA